MSYRFSSPHRKLDSSKLTYSVSALSDEGSENVSEKMSKSLLPPMPRSPKILGRSSISRLRAPAPKPSRVALSSLAIARKQVQLPTKAHLVEPQQDPKKPKIAVVNEKEYEVREVLGRGGFSTVYKVTDGLHRVYAMKQIEAQGQAKQHMFSFKTEINLLVSLKKNDRVIKLHNYEINDSCITMVLERGDCDLHRIIHTYHEEAPTFESIKFLSIEILECVKSVHAHNIVHSDLKPANFVIVNGRLKLIDFGIAAPIPDFTVNVYKDEQIRTVSYMAPETLLEQTGTMGFKVGKPSDYWSCGCIIYEMMFGKPPFKKFGRGQIEAVTSPATTVQYPSQTRYGTPVPRQMIKVLKMLLQKDPQKRATAHEALGILKEEYLHVDRAFLTDLVTYTSKLTQKTGRLPSNRRVEKISEAVFQQLKKIAGE